MGFCQVGILLVVMPESAQALVTEPLHGPFWLT